MESPRSAQSTGTFGSQSCQELGIVAALRCEARTVNSNHHCFDPRRVDFSKLHLSLFLSHQQRPQLQSNLLFQISPQTHRYYESFVMLWAKCHLSLNLHYLTPVLLLFTASLNLHRTFYSYFNSQISHL